MKHLLALASTLCLVAMPASAQFGLGSGDDGDPACALWLCIPGNFAPGCEVAETELYTRIDTDRPPMPDYAECSTMSLGIDGSYKLGYEVRVETTLICPEGYQEIYDTPEPEEAEAKVEPIEGDSETIDEKPVLLSCRACETDKDGEEVCGEIPPETLKVETSVVDSITVTIGDDTYPTYKLKR